MDAANREQKKRRGKTGQIRGPTEESTGSVYVIR